MIMIRPCMNQALDHSDIIHHFSAANSWSILHPTQTYLHDMTLDWHHVKSAIPRAIEPE